MFCAVDAASYVVSVKVFSIADIVELRVVFTLCRLLMMETPSVATMTISIIFVCIFFIFNLFSPSTDRTSAPLSLYFLSLCASKYFTHTRKFFQVPPDANAKNILQKYTLLKTLLKNYLTACQITEFFVY